MLMLKVDKITGLWIEDVVLAVRPLPDEEDVETVLIAQPCPEGLYKPCWDFEREEWYDAATPEEIEAIKGAAAVPEPTLEERTAALETTTQQQAAALDEVVTILEAIA